MKKSKLVKILALSAIFTSSVAALAACGGNKHELTLIGEQAATCTEDGHKAYYMCSHCDLIFADAEGKIETSLEEIKINKLNHDLHKHDAVTAECTKPGNIEYWTCSREEGKYFNAQGQEITDVVTTKSHDFSGSGVHAYVQPTTEAEGSEAYWQCNDCHNVYADANGDRQTTVEEMKIDRVKENLDGVLTDGFYNTEHALVIGGVSQKGDFVGFTVNGKKESDGIYLHIAADYNTSADDQQGDHGKIGVLVNFRNQNDLHLPGGLGACIEQTVYMELYLSGRVAYHDVNTVKYFNTETNTEEGKAKYTTTWELFLSYADLAKANGGKLAGAFEEKDGKTVLKQSYAPLMSFIGNMTHSPDDKFENPPAESMKDGDAKCDEKDNTWLIWYSHGYGDWGIEQKYMALGKDGFSMTVPRAVDTYTVSKNDCANATITVPETVDFDQSITGKVTVDEGYVFSGIKVNGKVVVTKGQATSGNEYDYEINVASLGLKWYETDIDLEFVITKLEYQDISFTLQGVAGGKTANLAEGTAVVLENEFGDRYETTVGANGVVTIAGVLCQDYVVKVADYIDGAIDVVKGETLGTVTLGYHFAHNAGDRADLVDLTDMNEKNASITLGAQGENGVDKHTIAAQIKLSEEMKNAKAYVLYTTVTVNGEVKNDTGEWLQRFAIRFAEGDAGNTYNNKFVIWWDDLGLNSNPSAIWANDGTTCGGGADRQATFEWLASNVMDGLQLKIVRNGQYIAISVYNLDDETWYTLLEGTTSASAKNDISFFVSGESFTFSEISFEKLQEIDRTLPVGETAGKLEHLKASNGDLFFVNGAIATEAELALTAVSMSVSVNAFEKDGETPVTLANGTEITLTGEFQNYIYTVGGTSDPDKMLVGTYEAYLYGYGKVNVVVPDAGGAVEIALVKTIAYGHREAVVNDGTGTVKVTGSGCPADGTPWSGYAEIVTDGTNADKSFEFTVKDTNVRNGAYDFAARRIAIQVAGDSGFFFWFNSANEVCVRQLKDTNIGANGGGQGGAYEGEIVSTDQGWMKGMVEGSGLQFHVLRYGTKIILNAYNGSEWVRIGETSCGANDKTNFVFYAQGDDYEFSAISVKALQHKTAVDPAEGNNYTGNVEYYFDGANYYTADGSVTTLEGVTIKQVDVTLAVTAKDLDGTTEATLADGTEIELVGKWQTYTYTVGGTSNPDKMLAGTYKAYLYGYAKADVVVPDAGGAVEIALVKTIAYGHREAVVNDGTGTVKVTGSGCPADGTPWSGYAEIVTDGTNADKSFEFTVKDTNVRNGAYDFAARRIAIQVAGNSGFFFWFNSANEVCVRHLKDTNIGASGSGQGGVYEGTEICHNHGWMKGMVEGNGLQFHILRYGTKIILNAYNGTDWVYIGETSCGADDKTNLVFYAQGDDYEFAAISVANVTVESVSAKAPSASETGNVAYLTDGANFYTPQGTIVTLDELTLPKLLATPTYTFDGSEEGVATKDNRPTETTVSADGIVIATNASGDWADFEADPIKVSITQTFAKEKTVEINFNLKGTGQVFWASNRFGIEVAGTNGLFVWNNSNAGLTCGIVDETMKTETLKLGEFGWLGAAIASENGANIKLIRKGGSIRCYAQNGSEWEYLGSVACSADDDTQIKFIGKGATWTVTDLTVSEIEAAE